MRINLERSRDDAPMEPTIPLGIYQSPTRGYDCKPGNRLSHRYIIANYLGLICRREVLSGGTGRLFHPRKFTPTKHNTTSYNISDVQLSQVYYNKCINILRPSMRELVLRALHCYNNIYIVKNGLVCYAFVLFKISVPYFLNLIDW